MSVLILVRHGQSIWNVQNRFTGWVDVELSEKGIKEAKKSGELIKSLDLNFDLYFTSYLKRATNTLKIILEILEKRNPVIIKAWQLNERHYGELTGLNKDEMKKKLGNIQVNKFRRSWDISPPPMKKNNKYNPRENSIFSEIPSNKIPDTESLKDTYNRVTEYFDNEIRHYLLKNKNVLVSAHGNSLRAMCKKLFNISNNKISKLEIPTGNPLIINFDKDLKNLDYKYLDQERKKSIIVNE